MSFLIKMFFHFPSFIFEVLMYTGMPGLTQRIYSA